MINVTSTFVRADIKTGKCYNSHVTIDGSRAQIAKARVEIWKEHGGSEK